MDKCCNFILICATFMRYVTSESCPQSVQTMTSVPSCPCNEVEWRRRSEAKQCSKFEQQCPKAGKSVYHCVINTFDNETLEVCAPEINIIGHSCVEYNVRGQTIQESRYVKCNNSCPFSYQSTDVYKYGECFQSVGRKNNDLKNITTVLKGCAENCCDCTAEKSWKTVALVMIAINIAFSITILWTTLLKRKFEKKHRGQNDDEHHSFIKQAQDGKNEDEVEETKARKDTTIAEDDQIQDDEQSDDIDSDFQNTSRGSADGEPDDGKDVIELTEKDDALKDDSKGIYVAAIDIGDQFMGMALAYPTPSGQCVKPIGHIESISIVLEENGKYRLLDEPALRKSIQQEKPATQCNYVYGLKMSDKKIDKQIYNGILGAILKRFEYALDKAEELKDVAENRIHYTFIVPTYWGKTATERLEAHISKVTFREDRQIDTQRIHIIKREETLSPFIQCVNARVLCLNFNVGNLVLDPQMKDAYAILHVGSNYCDFTFRPVGKELIPTLPRADHKWTDLPEEKVFYLMRKIFGKKVFAHWEEKYKADYIDLVTVFGNCIKRDNGYSERDIAFEMNLPESLVKLAGNEHGQTQLDIKQSIDELREKITLKEEWKIEIRQRFVEECFQEIKDSVKKMIKKMRKTFTKRNVKCVIMTGTYCKMEMIRAEAERRWFKDRNMHVTIAIPEDEQVFAMGGAYYVLKNNNKQN